MEGALIVVRTYPHEYTKWVLIMPRGNIIYIRYGYSFSNFVNILDILFILLYLYFYLWYDILL